MYWQAHRSHCNMPGLLQAWSLAIKICSSRCHASKYRYVITKAIKKQSFDKLLDLCAFPKREIGADQKFLIAQFQAFGHRAPLIWTFKSHCRKRQASTKQVGMRFEDSDAAACGAMQGM